MKKINTIEIINKQPEKIIRISRIDSYITRMRDRQKIEESFEKNRMNNNYFCKLIKYVKES